MRNLICIFFCFLVTSTVFSGNAFISRDLASKVGLVYGNASYGDCSVLRIDTYYSLDDTPYYYVVTLGLTPHAKSGLTQILADVKRVFHEKIALESDGAEQNLLKQKEIQMSFFSDYARVIVSTTRDRTPVFSIKRGLPIHLIRRFDALQNAKKHLKGTPVIGKTYVTGTYAFSGDFFDGESHILVNYFTLVMEEKEDVIQRFQEEVQEPRTTHHELENYQMIEKKKRRIRQKWKLIETEDIGYFQRKSNKRSTE